MNRISLAALFFALFFISGCAAWIKTSGVYVNQSQKYSISSPWGWMMLRGKELVLTRDGIWLENIIVSRHNIKDKLEYTKKKFVKGMLANEIAEVVLDNFSLDKKIGSFEVIENTPVRISCVDGFRLVYTFNAEDGLKKKGIYYGFISDDWVYGISYSAAVWNYFNKELEVFNGLVSSFTLASCGK